MSLSLPFRASSFFFGRRGSYGAHALPDEDGAGGSGSGGGGSSGDGPPGELQRPLLAVQAEVDLEICHDDSFVFSWHRLLLHVGWAAPAAGAAG